MRITSYDVLVDALDFPRQWNIQEMYNCFAPYLIILRGRGAYEVDSHRNTKLRPMPTSYSLYNIRVSLKDTSYLSVSHLRLNSLSPFVKKSKCLIQKVSNIVWYVKLYKMMYKVFYIRLQKLSASSLFKNVYECSVVFTEMKDIIAIIVTVNGLPGEHHSVDH